MGVGPLTDSVRFLQYHCCGVLNYSDWLEHNTTWWRETKSVDPAAIAPVSCCIENTTDCNHDPHKLQDKVKSTGACCRSKIIMVCLCIYLGLPWCAAKSYETCCLCRVWIFNCHGHITDFNCSVRMLWCMPHT